MIAIKNISNLLFAWLASGRFSELATSRHHTPYLTRHRLTAFVTRIRLVAVAFSVLTLVWIPFDAACQSARKFDHPSASNFDQGITLISCAV